MRATQEDFDKVSKGGGVGVCVWGGVSSQRGPLGCFLLRHTGWNRSFDCFSVL